MLDILSPDCELKVISINYVYKISGGVLQRVAKGFYVTRDYPKISRVMRDCAQLVRVIRDKIVQCDA